MGSHLSKAWGLDPSEPVGEEHVGFGPLELGDHMASSMHGGEVEALVGDIVASDLALQLEGVPGGQSGQAQVGDHLFDPLECSESGDRAVHVSRVMHHSVLLAIPLFVDPLRASVLLNVVDVLGAEVPLLDSAGNVESVSHLVGVQIVNDWLTEGAGRQVHQVLSPFWKGRLSLEQPGGVVLSSEGLLALSLGHFLTVGFVECGDVGSGAWGEALAIDIIDVDVSHKSFELNQVLEALSRNGGSEPCVLRFAIVVFDVLIESIIIESMPVGHLNESRSGVVVPVGASITNDEALKVNVEGSGTSLPPRGNQVENIRNVYPSIGFSGDVEGVGLVLGEEGFVPVEDGVEVVRSAGVVVEGAVGSAATGRESYASRAVQVDHVRKCVP